jgi:hypothetical protein
VIKPSRLRWAGHGARIGERTGAYRVWVGKTEGKRSPERPRRRWIFEKWDRGIDWIELAEDMDRWRAVVNAVMNLRVS